jgi:TolB protein
VARLTRAFGLIFAALLLCAVTACAPVGPSIPVMAEVPAVVPAIMQAADQPAGRILYVREGNLWLWQGGNNRQFSDGGTWYQPAFSPDGSEIAYVYWTFNFSDIFVMSADGAASRRLTKGQAGNIQDSDWAFRPRWSPDGQQIAYVSDANSQFPLVWMMGRDGGNRRQIVSATVGLEWADTMSWAPDGKRLAVTAGNVNHEPGQIYLVNVARGDVDRLTNHPNGAFDPAWSPDGNRIAYVARTSPGGDLWVQSLDGEKEAHVGGLQYVRSPVWSPDGKMLAVLAARSGSFQVWAMTVKDTPGGFEIGEPRQLTKDGAVDAPSGLTWAK